MTKWMTFSLLASLLWGVWALLFKLGTQRIAGMTAKVWETAGFAAATIPVLAAAGFHPVWNSGGFLYSALGGITGGLANYYFFVACESGGKASVLTAFIATCPVLTIALARLFLHEQIGPWQALGCVFAIAAAALMSE